MFRIIDHTTGQQTEADAYEVRAALEELYDTSDEATAQCVEALASHAERGTEIETGITEYLNVSIDRL